MYTVTVNGERKAYPQGTSYEDIAEEYQEQYGGLIGLVNVDGKVRELFKRLTKDCGLTFITLKESIGYKAYVRTLTMLFLKAVYDCFGQEAAQGCRVGFSVSNGHYVSIGGVPDEGSLLEATPETAALLEARMRKLAKEKLPFLKKSYALEEAVELFSKRGMKDKEKLFRYRRSSFVNVYEADGYCDYYYGFMLPNAGYVKWFEVMDYKGGFLLILPDRKQPDRTEPFAASPKLFATMKEAEAWGRKVGIETVGDLNQEICKGSLSDLILVQEAEQERKIGEIAKDIVKRDGVKFVMIAGPSSSGKTSFSHRLSIQLRTLGMRPYPIALDDYYVGREFTPKDENGDYDFECLEAIDVRQFNEDMSRLLAGETVELPIFNFKTGKREHSGRVKKLGTEEILVIEGIHGLNDKMSYSLPEESKYKIYISALTSINIDVHNRISTTDGRLLRRMVRDARTRGASAASTIAMWPSVRRGEDRNIFPYQEEADAMFNSALIYELAVLKQYAEPLLFGIEKTDPQYLEVKRLLKFLEYFLGVGSENLPNNSICREFVGGSCFLV
ncbi:MAG: nucleoside kinase [Clostridium sp.]|jgi:uridine kinase|nr:nucleoside kinase [Clostridium sp.]